MTREEIEKDRQYQLTGAAIDYCRKELPHYDGEALGEIVDAFEAGAKWAQNEMVDKACEWLEDKLRMYAGYSDTVDLVDSFRKAMEE